MTWIIFAIALFLVMGIRRIPAQQRGVMIRLGRIRGKVVGPGLVWLFPSIDKLVRISLEPFIVSLPPQSAITKDEIPIQLQASLQAVVRDPVCAATNSMDWRIYLISQLQEMIKEKIEELDFDNLPEHFPIWVQEIRQILNEKAAIIGVEVLDLQISNLSLRTRPA